jgi:hypothetical protein
MKKSEEKKYAVELTPEEMMVIMRSICYRDLEEGETEISARTYNKVFDAYSVAHGWK